MLFSIIIPIYNDEKFLAECLDSCLDQQLSKDEYEIICVDDGSTDRTPEMLRNYEARYSNLRVITKLHGGAYGYGRDVGFAAASGDYVWFVDHDDLVAPNALYDIKQAIEADDDFDRISFPHYEFLENMTPLELSMMKKGTLTANGPDSRALRVLWASVLRTSFLKEHSIQPRSGRIAAAGSFWGIDEFTVWGGDSVCMEECFDNGMRTKLLTGRPLYHYRRSTVSQTMDLSKDAGDRRERLKYYSSLLRGYLACTLKEQYLEERVANGSASRETTTNMIVKLRACVVELAIRSGRNWRDGIKRLREKDVFFSHKPPEYGFTFRDYWKTRTRKEKLSLSTFGYYFTYSLAGARWFRFLTLFTRLRGSNRELIQLYRKFKRKRIQKQGTSVARIDS